MKKTRYAQEAGAALLLFVIFFVVAISAVAFLLSRVGYYEVSSLNLLKNSKQAFLLTESATEDMLYRLMIGGWPVSATETLSVWGGNATTTYVIDINDSYAVRTRGAYGKSVRKSFVQLDLGTGSSFNYGVQSGNGGFRLVNSASIIGNVFSNGSITGQGGSIIRGDVISAGASGLVEDIHATGTVRANSIDDIHAEGDAHYNVEISPSIVVGSRFSLSPVPDMADLPIRDEEVEEWQDSIEATGTVIPVSLCTSGVYTINTNTTIGNVKIECNLEIKKTGPSTEVVLTGPVWVTGNVTFSGGPTISVAPSLGKRSVQIIADNPSNRLTSSKVTIANSTIFNGSGNPSSFIMVLSQNNSSETGGTETAISVGQSSAGALILYAGHGKIDVGNQISLRSISAHQIAVGNNSTITYDTGLVNTLFTGGPGGGFVISEWAQE